MTAAPNANHACKKDKHAIRYRGYSKALPDLPRGSLRMWTNDEPLFAIGMSTWKRTDGYAMLIYFASRNFCS